MEVGSDACVNGAGMRIAVTCGSGIRTGFALNNPNKMLPDLHVEMKKTRVPSSMVKWVG